MKKIYAFIAAACFTHVYVFCQGVGIGTSTPDSSSKLEIKSTTQGLLIPRLSTIQREQIVDPALGLLVYDRDKGTIYMYDSGGWLAMLFTDNTNNLPITPIAQASDLSADDNFGYDMDMDGNYAIIGAPLDDVGLDTNRGSAYIFFRDNGVWTEQEKITSILGADEDNFGFSVAISGNYAIVGAYHSDIGATNKGAAYIFERSGTDWTQIARLNDSGGGANDFFGYSVDIEGDYAVIGGYGVDSSGAAYVFYKDSVWTTGQPYQDKLSSTAGVNAVHFGWSVSISGNEVLVSDAYEVVAGNTDRGCAYIFLRIDTMWLQLARLIASDGAGGDRFGYSVSLDGNYAVIGAAFDDIGADTWRGSAYMFFKMGVWINNQPFQEKLLGPGGTANDIFGSRVDISGNHVVVGAQSHEDGPELNSGAAYLFKRSGTDWFLERSLEDENPELSGELGKGVAIDSPNILIGAPGKHNGKGEVQKLNF